MAKSILKLIACQLMAMFACWVLFSFLEVVTQNCYGSPVYHAWNLFQVFFR